MKLNNYYLQITGLLILIGLIVSSIYLLLKTILPTYDFMFWIDGDGDTQDIRFTISIVLAIPITTLMILGYHSWRKKWYENDRIITEIEEKFQIIDKIKKEVKEDKDFSHSYQNKILLEQIEKIISHQN